MYVVSLTSIPPRFDKLLPVLHSLLSQRPPPAQVFLCLPRRYHRFPEPWVLPILPSGITVRLATADLGPATKVLPVARDLHGQTEHLIYCDDDWILPPSWAANLLAAQKPGQAVTGAGYSISRLGRRPASDDPELVDIAQGFSGVLINPAWLSSRDLDPPDTAWAVDDIWLSGHLTGRGIPIRAAPKARDGMSVAFKDTHTLQEANVNGRSRNAANRACAEAIHQRYGIWPLIN